MNEQCMKCCYYYGKSYQGIFLNCAPHPNGIKTSCPDFCENKELDLDDITIGEMPILNSTFEDCALSMIDTENTSFNFFDGYFSDYRIRNIIIRVIEVSCFYQLDLSQRRNFKIEVKKIKTAKDREINLLAVIDKLSRNPLLAELSTRMRRYLLPQV